MKNILMNTEMTKAILDGRKTQTRRAITKLDILNIDVDWHTIEFNDKKIIENGEDGAWGEMSVEDFISTFSGYQKDEVIWVREPARVSSINNNCNGKLVFEYLADDGLKPTCARYTVNLYSIDMPNRFLDKNGAVNRKWINLQQGIPNGCTKEMARIFLKITDVRVERLSEITISDVEKEGCKTKYAEAKDNFIPLDTPHNWYIKLWNKTAPKGYKWNDNPYVFVYEFERVNKDGSVL